MNNKQKLLMLSFLEKNYPVLRLKNNGRFKRGIILDNGEQYLISNVSHNLKLKDELNKILKIVFSCNEDTSKSVLSNFLNLK
jgi:hypothetical protein